MLAFEWCVGWACCILGFAMFVGNCFHHLPDGSTGGFTVLATVAAEAVFAAGILLTKEIET